MCPKIPPTTSFFFAKFFHFLTNYNEKSPSFRVGMNHHPYYFLQIYYFFYLKTKYFRKKYNFF